MKVALLILVIAACGSSEQLSPDVVGPFTGTTQRYVVDKIVLPSSTTIARDFSDDLNNDHTLDNQVGMVAATLLGQGDGNPHGADIIASGVLASFVEIQAEDFTTADVVGVRYLARDGDPGEQLGGTFTRGQYNSNRTRTTRHPVETIVRLPFFADIDPTMVRIVGTEIDLDPDGQGGYNGILRGGVLVDDAIAAATDGLIQMVGGNPRDHLFLLADLDDNRDGVMTRDEVAHSTLVQSMLAPDIQLFQGTAYAPRPGGRNADALSFGFGFHITPCTSGNCAVAPPTNTCFDRVLDATEPSLDCGSTCALKCPSAARCKVPEDCQTGACDSGACRAPTCTDGVANGTEADVDCGGPCATKCALGKQCLGDNDCASGICKGFFGGVCSTSR